ncbi:hypothetical protein FKW77_009134 [Venturia effusa]|uniref:Cupin type-1 domain-containing protein n=1 Tax=Venturia effusa TaxID=50376 RepID=A0A517LBL8_9PEZI|nr:hypothetical protein FKW77_009134 [Venturia effusa]
MVSVSRLASFGQISVFFAILLSYAAFALPTIEKRQDVESVNDPVGPPGAQGSLRGSVSLAGYDPAESVGMPPSVIPPSDFQLAPGQTEDNDLGLYLDFKNVENPQPLRGDAESPTDPGPRNMEYDRLNSDLFARPSTDSGDVPNSKWPFGLSSNRHGNPYSAGWARQQNIDELPVATAMAGVDMRLAPNAYREMHWHKADEWSYMLNGSVRITSMDENGQVFEDDLEAGDVWFFPAGIPHGIQAKEDGCEFLLVFDDGSFSEDNTFLATSLFYRTPKEVLAKNFRTDVSAFDNIPKSELYIFPGTPAPSNISVQNSTGPAGSISNDKAYSYHLSRQQPYSVPGGTVKIIDSINFPISTNISAAIFTIEPGAMREMHWHTTSDEWNYFISGSARLTTFAGAAGARTFDFTAGDVGYIPVPNAHYVENVGNETVTYLEILRAPQYNDISVGQWLGLTPKQVVKDTLNLPDSVLDNLPKVKPFIVPGRVGNLNTNFTGDAL